MNKSVLIFENSNAPHESSVVSAAKVFSGMGFDVYLCLNNSSIGRLESARLGDVNVEILNISAPKNWFRLLSLKLKSRYVLYNTVLLRNIASVILLSLFGRGNIYYVRNINTWLKFPDVGRASLFNYTLGCIIHLGKRLLMLRSSAYVVGTYNLAANFREKVDYKCAVIPFNLFESANVIANQHLKVRLVIPGTIDFRRKNIRVIFDACSFLSREELQGIEVIFLGRPVSDQDAEFMVSFRHLLGDSLFYYNSYVDDSEFDRVMKSAHIVLGVLNNVYVDKYGNCEEYGRTKDTGVEAHAIAYAKPLFVNAGYTPDVYLKRLSVLFSDGEDLARKIRQFATGEMVFDLQDLVSDLSAYSVGHLSKNVRDFFS